MGGATKTGNGRRPPSNDDGSATQKQKRVESQANRRHVMQHAYMTLEPAQRQKVAEWIQQGAKLSEIQNRLASELGVRMTYMEVRILVDDLKLTPKDAEPMKSTPTLGQAPAAKAPSQQPEPKAFPEAEPSGAGSVSVSVDQLARPGAVASGKVTFSDGKTGQWYFDQTGRLGLVPPEPGYRPSQGDLQEFQAALEQELSRMGM